MRTLTFVYGDSDLLVHQKVRVGKLQREQLLLAENEHQSAEIAEGGGIEDDNKSQRRKPHQDSHPESPHIRLECVRCRRLCFIDVYLLVSHPAYRPVRSRRERRYRTR